MMSKPSGLFVLVFGVYVSLFLTACADDSVNLEEVPAAVDIPDARTDTDQQSWRSLPSPSTEPHQKEQVGELPPEEPPRRRRKRKRRPHADGPHRYNGEERARVRRPHPEEEQWRAEEIPEETHPRRAQYRGTEEHQFQSRSSIEEPITPMSSNEKTQDRSRGESENDKSYRRQYSEAKMQKSSESNAAIDLKSILKQAGGLSLSEVLQQRNLSLADLLKGKQNALSALTEQTPIETYPGLKNNRRKTPITEKKEDEQLLSERIQSEELDRSKIRPYTRYNEDERRISQSSNLSDNEPEVVSTAQPAIVEEMKIVEIKTVKESFSDEQPKNRLLTIGTRVVMNITEDNSRGSSWTPEIHEKLTNKETPVIENYSSGMLFRRRLPVLGLANPVEISTTEDNSRTFSWASENNEKPHLNEEKTVGENSSDEPILQRRLPSIGFTKGVEITAENQRRQSILSNENIENIHLNREKAFVDNLDKKLPKSDIPFSVLPKQEETNSTEETTGRQRFRPTKNNEKRRLPNLRKPDNSKDVQIKLYGDLNNSLQNDLNKSDDIATVPRRLPYKWSNRPHLLTSQRTIGNASVEEANTDSTMNSTEFAQFAIQSVETSTEVQVNLTLEDDKIQKEIPTITTDKTVGQDMRAIQNRLLLKPRLRLPSLKAIKLLSEKMMEKNNVSGGREISTVTEASIPNKAVTINISSLLNNHIISKIDFSSANLRTNVPDDLKEYIGDKLRPVVRKQMIDQYNVESSIPSIFEINAQPSSVANKTATDWQDIGASSGEIKNEIVQGPVHVIDSYPSIFADISTEGLEETDKEQLQDLIRGRGGSRLSRVLASRNMTLEQLIEHRERGSSQLHLAEIFKNRTTELHQKTTPTPTHTSVTVNNVQIDTAFKNFPDFNTQSIKIFIPDNIKTDSDGSNYFTSVAKIKPTDEVKTETRESSLRSFANFPIFPLVKPHVNPGIVEVKHKTYTLPTWKSVIYPNNYNPFESNELPNRGIVTSRFPQPVIKASNMMMTPDEAGLVEQIENNGVAESKNELLDIDISGHSIYKKETIDEEPRMPVGVRSAIIASSVIIGISILIFLAIFVACRCRQKRSNKLRYTSSFSAGRGRIPILTRECSGKRRSSPVFFTSSHPRNSKANTMDSNTQDVQDYLWDTLRKPFQ